MCSAIIYNAKDSTTNIYDDYVNDLEKRRGQSKNYRRAEVEIREYIGNIMCSSWQSEQVWKYFHPNVEESKDTHKLYREDVGPKQVTNI